MCFVGVVWCRRAEEEGFVVVAKSEGIKKWTKGDAEEFYGEHKGKAFFEDLVDFMSGGPVVELCLEKVCAKYSRGIMNAKTRRHPVDMIQRPKN